jgi:hypothetical protein
MRGVRLVTCGRRRKELLLPITYCEHGGGQTGIAARLMISWRRRHALTRRVCRSCGSRDGLAEMGTGAEIVVGQSSLGPGPAWTRVGRRLDSWSTATPIISHVGCRVWVVLDYVERTESRPCGPSWANQPTTRARQLPGDCDKNHHT